jgi:hypothetical protein
MGKSRVPTSAVNNLERNNCESGKGRKSAPKFLKYLAEEKEIAKPGPLNVQQTSFTVRDI